eukprot:m.75793 g.75793  ORF g.75793 m.75793 type:complete len:409 (-) comp10449_c0_seq1:161-1387(-)
MWVLIVAAAAGSAESPRPETDWFSAAGHGVFTHFLDLLQNSNGRNSQGYNTTWNETVAQFDVEAYAADAAATGARYATITIMQGTRYMIAPNQVFDGYTGFAPGEACASRDLVLDLWTALDKRGLKLLLYYTGDGPCRDADPATAAAFNWTPDGVDEVFVQRWANVLKEYALRYGDKVSGWWIDGCYASRLKYNDTLLEYYHNAIRAGNPSAVIGYNNGVKHPIASPRPWASGGEVSAWEDMTCGENNGFDDVPTSRWVTGQAVAGGPNVTVQWHSLGFLGSQWAANGTCICQGMAPSCTSHGCTHLSPTDIKLYTQEINSVGGVLTLDLQLWRNGSLNAEQVSALSEAWTTPRICSADHGNTTCCCGQAVACHGNPVTPGKQCPQALPICRGFLYGSHYGTCVGAAV